MIFRRLYGIPAINSKAVLVHKLRKEFDGISLATIKTAVKDSVDLEKAREKLISIIKEASEKVNDKLSERVAKENLIVCAKRPGIGSVMLRVGCETDFVARGQIFQEMAATVASTALFLNCKHAKIDRIDVSKFLKSDVVIGGVVVPNSSVESVLQETELKVREKIELKEGIIVGERESFNRREDGSACSVFAVSSLHGKLNTSSNNTSVGKDGITFEFGKFASMALYRVSYDKETNIERDIKLETQLGENIAQQIIGMNPANVDNLLQQQYLFDQKVTVNEAIQTFCLQNSLSGFEILDFFRLNASNA